MTEPVDKILSFDEMRQSLRKKHQETIGIFDAEIKSFWTWGEKKKNLITFKNILTMVFTNSESNLEQWEYIDNIEKAVLYMGKQIESSKGKTKELSEALANLKKDIIPKVNASHAALQRLDSILRGEQPETAKKDQKNPQEDKKADAYRV